MLTKYHGVSILDWQSKSDPRQKFAGAYSSYNKIIIKKNYHSNDKTSPEKCEKNLDSGLSPNNVYY